MGTADETKVCTVLYRTVKQRCDEFVEYYFKFIKKKNVSGHCQYTIRPYTKELKRHLYISISDM